MSSECYCPYCEEDCGSHFDDCYEPNTEYEHECPKCEKTFQFSIEYEANFDSWKTPCLNGGEHKFVKICGCPKEYFENKRRCKYCQKEITVKKNGAEDE